MGLSPQGMNEIAHIDELALELIDFDRTADLGIDEWFPYIFERLDAELQSPNVNELLEARTVRVVAILGGTGVPVVTTAVVSDVIVEKLLRSDAFLARPESKFLPSAYVTAFQAGAEKHQVQFAGHEDKAAVNRDVVVMLLEALQKGGVPLLLGTDAGTGSLGIVPGFTIHRELAILTDNGLTPYEAIRTGTVNASAAIAAMTGNDDFGTVEVGKRADLLLVGANPLEDVAHIETQLRGVMAAGTWYTQAELREMIAYDP